MVGRPSWLTNLETLNRGSRVWSLPSRCTLEPWARDRKGGKCERRPRSLRMWSWRKDGAGVGAGAGLPHQDGPAGQGPWPGGAGGGQGQSNAEPFRAAPLGVPEGWGAGRTEMGCWVKSWGWKGQKHWWETDRRQTAGQHKNMGFLRVGSPGQTANKPGLVLLPETGTALFTGGPHKTPDESTLEGPSTPPQPRPPYSGRVGGSESEGLLSLLC